MTSRRAACPLRSRTTSARDGKPSKATTQAAAWFWSGNVGASSEAVAARSASRAPSSARLKLNSASKGKARPKAGFEFRNALLVGEDSAPVGVDFGLKPARMSSSLTTASSAATARLMRVS